MKNKAIVLIIGILLPIVQASAINIKNKIHEEIVNLDIGENVKIINKEVVDGVRLGSNYRYEVRPSYGGSRNLDMDGEHFFGRGLYTRVDKLTFNVGVNPGEIFDNNNKLPISFGISHDSQVIFHRQFTSQKKALLALPYSVWNLPINAKKARKLETGTFVSMPVTLNLSIGKGVGFTDGILSGSISGSLAWSGKFRVDVYKMKNDYLRVKLIALRQKSKGINGTLDLGFNIFEYDAGNKYANKLVDKANRKLLKILDTNVARFGLSRNKSNLFMVDYIFDLKNEDAREAYDAILSSTLKFKRLEMMNPFFDYEKIKAELLADVTFAERILQEDKNKPLSRRRISLNFKGRDNATSKTSSFKLGNNFLQFREGTSASVHNIASEDVDGNTVHYEFDSLDVSFGSTALFSWSEKDVKSTYSALFRTDKEGNTKRFVEMAFSYDLKDKIFRSSEQEQAANLFRSIVPRVLRKNIEWNDWKNLKKRKNARAYFQVRFNREALYSIKHMNEEQIRESLEAFIEKNKDMLTYVSPWDPSLWKCIDESVPYNSCLPEDIVDPDPLQRWQMKFEYQYEGMIKQLKIILNKEDDSQTAKNLQHFALKGLKDNDVFLNIGLGYLSSLIPEDKVLKNVKLKLEVSSKKMKPVTYVNKVDENDVLFEEFDYIRGILNNQSFDPRSMSANIDDYYQGLICKTIDEDCRVEVAQPDY
ncbi:MAG: hypothetical protein ISR65_05645 [Bacteriovoracaceae bacterium]|nr:hypothetical protein [Bacteriovoracaceae bacterium]